MMMTTTAALWEIPEFYHLDNDFFQAQEKKQLHNAYENFRRYTKCKLFDQEENADDDEHAQMLLESKVQLFQLFVRTQLSNIRNSNPFRQKHQRIFIERLFYLVLNNIELTHFSTYNVNSIISISKELEKYQRSTNKIILNIGKLNTVVQFVLSFSSTSISSFQLNNLFYLLLNDMNDFSGKIIDRIAELLRIYHSMTYGHAITKQYLITTLDNAINTVNFVNPLVYPFYENFLNSSYVYKGPFILPLLKKTISVSSYTIIQNLSIALLGITLDDFECEEKYLSLTSEQCYHIRLIIRYLTYIFKQYHYKIEYPLNNLDKQIIVQLINSILFHEKTYLTLKQLLDLYMKYVHRFSQMKVKRLLYDLLEKSSFELHSVETVGSFIELNHLTSKLISNENKPSEDDLWLNNNQLRLIMHKLYSNKIYNEIILPFINGDFNEERTIDDILAYFDNNIELEQEQVIDVQDMKLKLTILP